LSFVEAFAPSRAENKLKAKKQEGSGYACDGSLAMPVLPAVRPLLPQNWTAPDLA
jgi:hypothetical protein